ncbi:MAG TPA: peptidylprolyl isomerase [Gaiellaceae bacterium]|nr:peptidylprolyl isomerase [Gaiellaceae bacterium]
MKPSRVTFVLLGAVLVLAAAACGGSGSGLPSGAVAEVNGTPIARADLDALVERARKGYEAQKQSFPKEGTQQFQSVQALYLNYLVQKAEFEQQAKDLHVKVTEKDVDKALASFLKTRYSGKKAQFQKDLQAQGLTLATFKDTLRTSVLSQKIFEVVTKKVKVSPADVFAYYQQNSASYGSAASRDVRHILVAVKDANGQVDFAKSKAKADQIRKQVTNANFAALAKKYSDDPGSKDSGGKYTDTKGSFVPQFENVAFKLKTGEISQPVKSSFGYHIIQALAPVKPGNRTPFSRVKASIRATLLQNQRNQVMSQWVSDLTARYKSKVKYATGFEPPNLSTTDTTTATQ